MAAQSTRMQTLVSDLLTLSRLEGSPPVGSTSWVSAHLLMQQVAQEAQALSGHVTEGSGKPHAIRFEESEASDISSARSKLAECHGQSGGQCGAVHTAGRRDCRALAMSAGRTG